MQLNKTNKRLYLLLFCLCLMGALSVLPYMNFLGILPQLSTKTWLMAFAQSCVLYAVVCSLSYLLLKKVDLSPFSTEKPLQRIAMPAIIAGVMLGLVIFALDKTIFSSAAPQLIRPPIWTGALASFYGGFNEEVLCRLFLLTLFYFLLSKAFKEQRLLCLGLAIVLSSLLFAASHLPALFKMVYAPSSLSISRVMVLNALPGLIFGWLYVSRSLWAAMAGHFFTDLMIHVVLPG